MTRKGLLVWMAVWAIWGWVGAAQASLIIIGEGSYGDFRGELTYQAEAPDQATLTLELKNTSLETRGGYLTAFVFNNPAERITGVAMTPAQHEFNLLTGKKSQDGIKEAPYGVFDLGASIWKNLDGGNPQQGLAAGQNDTFTFALTGADLHQLDEWSFIRELSASPEGGGPAFFVARFRGFDGGLSDKVPAQLALQVVPTPLPGSMLLLAAGLGIAGLAGWRGRGR